MKTIDGMTYYSLGDLVERLGATEQTVRRWIDSGRLSGVRHPGSGHRMVAKEELQKFLVQINAASDNN